LRHDSSDPIHSTKQNTAAQEATATSNATISPEVATTSSGIPPPQPGNIAGTLCVIKSITFTLDPKIIKSFKKNRKKCPVEIFAKISSYPLIVFKNTTKVRAHLISPR